MKLHKLCMIFVAAAMTAAILPGCSSAAGNKETDKKADSSLKQIENELDGMNEFRPSDCGIQAQDVYEYPFVGMTAKLSEKLREKMDSREVFVFNSEDYSDEHTISYAVLRFSTTTEEQREEKGMSVDILSWEEQLEKLGAIGVYKKDRVSELDELTACDTHVKIGESTDSAYEYYISTNSKGNQELAEELKKSEITLSEMHEFDANLSYTAFSADRVDGVVTVGNFTTKDIFEKTYTQDMFKDYDLTLVNVFTTWCSPCVNEMPELEKLRQEYEKKGVKLGVVAVVLDVKTASGTDEGALERAKALYERSEAQFPFLIPDDGNMNDRLTGIESVPESFFVDKNGNIISDPYVGANSKKEWARIVEQELAELEGGN